MLFRSDHDLIINGELTLMDQTHPHNIVATFDRESFIFEFTTSIDRTKWGVTYNSAGLGGELGDRAIADMVELEGALVLNRTEDETSTDAEAIPEHDEDSLAEEEGEEELAEAEYYRQKSEEH